MTWTRILWVAWACCAHITLAQMCDPNPPPPCGRLHPDNIFLVGTVIDVAADLGAMGRAVRFHVDEPFLGIPAGAQEIVIRNGGSHFLKGHTFLIDAFARAKDEQGNPLLDLTTCGATADLSSDPNNQMLRFLRARAKGKVAPESLTVYAFDEGSPLPGVDVTVALSPDAGKRSTSRTNSKGEAKFERLEPGSFTISAARQHYRIEEGPLSESQINILPGACPSAVVHLSPDSSVSGVLLDVKGAPVPFFDLDLIEMSKVHTSFKTVTKADGSFHFESVSPGTYWLGVNLTWYGSVDVPPTYYPGKLKKSEAVPIVVKLGEAVSGLRFATPDFGAERKVRVCVVDAYSAPVPSVRILNSHEVEGPRRASLGETLMTDENGCTTATGYTKVQYAIRVSTGSYKGDPPRDSDFVIIEPGDQPIEVRLLLKNGK